MRIALIAPSVSLSERERAKLQNRLDKIHRVLARRSGLQIHATMSRHRHSCEAEVTLRAMRHTLVVTGSGPSDFAALQSALEKLGKQVVRNKRKIVEAHRPGRQRDQPSPVTSAALPAVEEPPPGPVQRDGVAKVRPGRTEAKPMSAEGALLQLSAGKRNYVAYRDADTGHLAVLIRRPDGSAELVEGP